MALTKISGNVVQQNNFTLSGVVTATSFTGDLTGNVTGTATTATNLADGANITTGTISNDRLPATITKNLTGDVTGNLTGNVTGNVTGTATTATNLADGANITTGTISNDRLPATITKNLTGDVTGNLTGNVSSSGANTLGSLTVTNDATVGGALTITGNLTVNGTTTTIDTVVTAVDSIAVDGDITAGGNLNVTGVATATTFNGNLTGNVTGNVTGNLTGNLQSTASLAGISSSISDTAVDVFVYDTRKDSDGGAWRKRTQHTSWYNETLNTATRGSRREFPAVAVIVYGNGFINIYDGDDPDMPLWMAFNSGNFYTFVTDIPTAISMLNGVLVWACKHTETAYAQNNLVICNFISEKTERISHAGDTFSGTDRTGIVNRNVWTNSSTWLGPRTLNLVNYYINDVAMTVLPNAPIDDATGLPIPTIAVATDGGVSVIKDDGTVTSGGEVNSSWKVNKVFIDSNYNIWGSEGTEYSPGIQLLSTLPYSSVADIGTGTLGYQLTTQVTTAYGRNTSWPFILGNYGSFLNEHVSGKEYIFNGAGYGLTFLQDNTTDRSSSMVAYAATSYNTGWMHGDIKGAFLSDTDATNVTGTELITNGTFDSDVSGWTTVTSTITYNSGAANIARNGGTGANAIYQNISGLTVGEKYLITIKITALSNLVSVYFDPDGSESAVEPITATATGTYTAIYTATQTSGIFSINATASSSATATVDNISMRVAEEDRSVNNNGLQVFGTINKSAVATGAELVAYGPFSNSNYLKQPYNSDLNWDGNATWSIMFWVYFTENQAYDILMSREQPDGTGNRWNIDTGNQNAITFKSQGSSRVACPGDSVFGVWRHICFTQEGNFYRAYRDGVQVGTYIGVDNFYNTSAELKIGRDVNYAADKSKLALVRLSRSFPSAEQVKKIYEDEKVLFQENADCTLHGSSDAVTALAYDDSTNLLYAGTSSGRSDFQGLRRINNTTTAVTTAISASNGLVAEQ